MNRCFSLFAAAVLAFSFGCAMESANTVPERRAEADGAIPAARSYAAAPRAFAPRRKGVARDALSEVGTGNFRAPAGHQMAFTAYLRLNVRDVRAAVRQARELALKFGGYVKRMDDYSAVLAIPVEKADDALAALARGGVVSSLRIEGEDVTEQSINLKVRLDNLEKSRQRLLALLERTAKVDEMVKVETAITRVTTELERLQAQQKNLQGRIQFVTIHVHYSAVVSQQPSRNVTPVGWVNRLGEDLLSFDQRVSGDDSSLIFDLVFPEGFVRCSASTAVSGSNCVIELYSHEGAVTAAHWYGNDYAQLKFYGPIIEKALSKRFKVPVKVTRGVIDGHEAAVYTVNPVIGDDSYTYRVAVAVVKSKVKVIAARAKTADFARDLPESAWKKMLESVDF